MKKLIILLVCTVIFSGNAYGWSINPFTDEEQAAVANVIANDANENGIPDTTDATGDGTGDMVEANYDTEPEFESNLFAVTTPGELDTWAEFLALFGITGTPDGSKFLRDDGSWQTVSTGSGDVTGPDGATTGNIPVFSDTTGKVVEDSGNAPGDFEPADATILKEANIGTSAGTVAAGDDARFTDARTPTSHGNEAHSSTFLVTESDPGVATHESTYTHTDIALNTTDRHASGSDAETAATIEDIITGSGAETTPADAWEFPTVVSSVLKRVTWANIKAGLKTYFDTLYKSVDDPINIQFGISDPENWPTDSERGTQSHVLFKNTTGSSLTLSEIEANADEDDYTWTLYKTGGEYDFGTANDVVLDVIACSTDRTNRYSFGTTSGFDNSTLEDGRSLIWQHTSGTAGDIWGYIKLTP